MVDQPIFLDGADTGDLDACGDGVMERLADPGNPMYQAITRLVMRELTMRRDPEFEGFLHESDDHEFLEFRLAVLVALDRVWDDLRGQSDARRGQFVHRMEALEGAEDRGEGGGAGRGNPGCGTTICVRFPALSGSVNPRNRALPCPTGA